MIASGYDGASMSARSPIPVGSSPEARSNAAVSGTTSAHARSTLRDDARVAIEAAWARAARAGRLPAGPEAVDVTVDDPAVPGTGEIVAWIDELVSGRFAGSGSVGQAGWPPHPPVQR